MTAPKRQANELVERVAERCDTCRFHWWHDPTTPYICRRNAPVASGGMMSDPVTMWPIIQPLDWCGEYAPNEVEQDRRQKELDDDPCPF